MIKRLLLLAALCLPLSAALTTVTQTIKTPDGSLASGVAYIRITAPCASGSDYIGDKTITVRFTGGAFSVALAPNDTCVPAGTSYTVGWALAGGAQRNQIWVVPTSVSPVSVNSVAIPVAPTPSVAVALTQLSRSGATPDQALCWNGTSWAPGDCGGGGAPSAHASTHASAGSDPVTPAAIGAEPVDANIVRKDGNGSVAIGCTIPIGAPAGSGCFAGNVYIRTSGTTPGFDSYDGTAHFNAPSVSAGSYTILLSGIAASADLADAPNISTLTGNQTITGDKIYSGSNTYQGVQDASGAAHTTPAKTGAAADKPPACSAGEIYFGTDSTAGRNLFLCTTPGSPGTWTQLLAPGAGGGGGITRFGGATAFTATVWLGFGGASSTASTQSFPSTGETYTDLYCSSSAAPGAGASWVFAFNTNNGGADTALTCTISGTETKCAHTGQTITTTAAASPTTGSMLSVHAIASTGPAPTSARMFCSAKYQ